MLDQLNLLATNPQSAYIAATIIAVVALYLYFMWFRPEAESLNDRLVQLKNSLATTEGEWGNVANTAREIAATHPSVQISWSETERRVLLIRTEEGMRHRLLGSPRDLWSAQKLLSRTINLPLIEGIPNLLVGVGLLLTFFFLTVAITKAALAIGPSTPAAAPGAETDFVAAASAMLTAAGSKFMTSLAGLFASIIWTIALRRRMAELTKVCERILDHLERWVPGNGVEEILALHVEKTGAMAATSADGLDVATELLNEARDQTGTLKRFETDLAVSLAGAITSAFAPQMEAMTEKLTGAIDNLSRNLTAINQDALKEMLKDFKTTLSENTTTEMAAFRQALTTLAAKLEEAGGSIDRGATDAAAKLDAAGAGLVESVDGVATTLSGSAANLGVATQNVNEAITELAGMLTRITEQGDRGVAVLQAAITAGQETSATLIRAGDHLSETAALLESVAGRVAETLDGVEELTAEQRAVIAQATEAAPAAAAAINNVATQLQAAVTVTRDAMNDTRQSIETASTALTTTVDSITTGVTEYSGLVAKLHSEMDRQLAAAIGGLDRTVTELGDSLEELNETLETTRGGRP